MLRPDGAGFKRPVTVHRETAYFKGPHKQYLYSLIAVIKGQGIKKHELVMHIFFLIRSELSLMGSRDASLERDGAEHQRVRRVPH